MTEQPEHKRIEAMEYCANVNNQTSSLRRIIMTKIESLELELAARKMEVVRLKVLKAGFAQAVPEYFNRNELELAIGIIEGKPVWEDDIICDEGGDTCNAKRHYDYPGAWSWNPPTPKTVLVELTIEDAKWMASAFNSPNPGHPSNIASACRKALENLK